MEDGELRRKHNALVDDIRQLSDDVLLGAGRAAAMLWFVEALIRTHPDRAALARELDALRSFYEQPFPDGSAAHDAFLRTAAAIRTRCALPG